MIYSVAFWKGTGERVLRTFVQAFVPVFLSALGTSLTGVLNAWTAPWLAALESASGIALGAAFLSFMFCLGNARFTAGEPAPSAADASEGDDVADDEPQVVADDGTDAVPQVVASDNAHDDADYDPSAPRRAAEPVEAEPASVPVVVAPAAAPVLVGPFIA